MPKFVLSTALTEIAHLCMCFTCEISHGIFHMWNFTCEISHVKFHMWNFTWEMLHGKFHMWKIPCEISHVKRLIWFICAIWYVNHLTWKLTRENSYLNFHKWNCFWWEKSHVKFIIIWLFKSQISHVILSVRLSSCEISHVTIFLCSYTWASHIKFRMRYFTCNKITCEESHVKFHTCEMSQVISYVKFHMWHVNHLWILSISYASSPRQAIHSTPLSPPLILCFCVNLPPLFTILSLLCHSRARVKLQLCETKAFKLNRSIQILKEFQSIGSEFYIKATRRLVMS